MRNYLIRRILQMIPLFLGVALVTFGVLSLVGDPFAQMAINPRIRPEDIARLKHAWGFDLPWYLRFFKWFWSMITGNWGVSIFAGGKPVTELVGRAITYTLRFSIASLVLAFIIGVPIGIYSALHQYTFFDYFFTFFAFFGMSMPTFWFGFILMMIFGLRLGWLPIGGVMTPGIETAPFVVRFFDQAKYMILPVIVLSLFSMASWMRYARSSMLEVIRMDYVRTARAKGLPERTVIFKHALRNALIPIVTLLGLSLPGIISGATITETVFSIPGMGRLTVDAMLSNDYPVAMVCLLLESSLLIIGNLIADLLYAVVDPRIRYS
ncbi:ABC transporter permease [Caldisericum exile]|uniref:Oligopeptide ABC transporter permease protein n=1 Tax=Caldisericum exile (strain DSM 21853 / NBRC 104410 / AZM16c01) TaxID=511051 RepID=A0A7U6GFB8_CALEA|nr:ABC transporter permease [Caldisericum exile]BAL81296.1 oligopeptide ABC transporter permease protein [Caldisericum exile AZM16c01]